MQGAEGQVAGLRDGQRGRDGLEVAHFTDQHHVGVLPQDGLERVLERMRVGEDLALVHHALLVLVDELDRVLDGDDVLGPLGVDLVNHRGERGRLAGAGGTGDQDEALGAIRHLLDDRGQAQLVEPADLDRDDADGGGDRAALTIHVAAETGEALDAEGQIELVFLLELLLLSLVQDAIRQALRVLGHLHLELGEGGQLAVQPNLRVRPGGDVQVGGPTLDHQRQQVVHRRGHWFLEPP